MGGVRRAAANMSIIPKQQQQCVDATVQPVWMEELESLHATVMLMTGDGNGDVDGDEEEQGEGGFAALARALPRAFPGGDVGGAVTAAIRTGCRIANEIALASGRAAATHQDDGGDDDALLADCRARVHHVMSALYYVNHALSSSAVAWRIVAGGGEGGGRVDDTDLAAGIARFSVPDAEDANRFQLLLLFLLNRVQTLGYRRRNGALHRRMRADQGGLHDTHAWERVCDMRDFVYESTRKEVQFDMWMNLTSMRTNLQAAVEHLTVCHDVQLPDLQRDRHVFAFSDGIYLAADDRFVRYGSRAHRQLPTELVAAKYFDQPFPRDDGGDGDGNDDDDDDEPDWYALPTPHLQSILDYQNMGPDVSRWMYALLGRLLYDVGELDGWQVLPFLKGAASSGKSTILTRVCRNFYEAEDVGTLSNNIERKFGLSALADKLLFIGPEIKADIQLEQAEFQSVVSGETVQVATKFKTAQTVEWRVPGALAGNEVPGWVDNSGSINRRIVIFEFPNRVHDGDMELGKKIEASIAAVLVKCNRAYLQAVARHARDNLWKHLPAAFHASKEDFTESGSSLVQFLRSGELEFGDVDVYMPHDAFIAAYNTFCHSMGLTFIGYKKDKHGQPLMDAGCRVEIATKCYPRTPPGVERGRGGGGGGGGGGGAVTTKFVIGCDKVQASRLSMWEDDNAGDGLDAGRPVFSF
jgi:hypothetical protein